MVPSNAMVMPAKAENEATVPLPSKRPENICPAAAITTPTQQQQQQPTTPLSEYNPTLLPMQWNFQQRRES
jgi:hypothetical protein